MLPLPGERRITRYGPEAIDTAKCFMFRLFASAPAASSAWPARRRGSGSGRNRARAKAKDMNDSKPVSDATPVSSVDLVVEALQARWPNRVSTSQAVRTQHANNFTWH